MLFRLEIFNFCQKHFVSGVLEVTDKRAFWLSKSFFESGKVLLELIDTKFGYFFCNSYNFIWIFFWINLFVLGYGLSCKDFDELCKLIGSDFCVKFKFSEAWEFLNDLFVSNRILLRVKGKGYCFFGIKETEGGNGLIYPLGCFKFLLQLLNSPFKFRHLSFNDLVLFF